VGHVLAGWLVKGGVVAIVLCAGFGVRLAAASSRVPVATQLVTGDCTPQSQRWWAAGCSDLHVLG
jgi:hypothetical protein